MFMKNILRKIIANKKGNVLTVFALSAVPLVLAIGAGIEFGHNSNIRNKIQDATDTGAIAAANKLNVLNKGEATTGVEAIGNAMARMQVETEPFANDIAFNTDVVSEQGIVTVSGQATIKPLFNILSNKNLEVNATSVAETLNKIPLCVMHTDDGTFKVYNEANLVANGCMVHSNENISVVDTALMTADRVKAVGSVTAAP
jgi:Flp pilus assembly protein TadG